MAPQWNEMMEFEISSPKDVLEIIIINDYIPSNKEILAIKRFRIDGTPVEDDASSQD